MAMFTERQRVAGDKMRGRVEDDMFMFPKHLPRKAFSALQRASSGENRFRDMVRAVSG
jgi:hypothetical protein